MTKMTRLALVVGMLAFFSAPVFADPMDGNSGGVRERHGYGMKKQHESSQCPVVSKLKMKAHFLLKHKDDLALTEDQVKSIKDLKLAAEKDAIRQKADAEIFMLDLRSNLEGDKVDVEGANALIDKGFASLAASTKANVETYAKLKGLLTPEQTAKMKEIFKNKENSWKNKDK